MKAFLLFFALMAGAGSFILGASAKAEHASVPVTCAPPVNCDAFSWTNPPRNWLGRSMAWKRTGDVTVDRSGKSVMLREHGTNADSRACRDVPVVPSRVGQAAVLVSYTRAERVADRPLDITGRPNLYGYFLDSNGRILSYLQGQQMLYHGARDGEWVVSFGKFVVPSGTVKVRYFLEQAERRGSAKDGRAAEFRHPGLYFMENYTEGDKIIQGYINGLPLMN